MTGTLDAAKDEIAFTAPAAPQKSLVFAVESDRATPTR